MKFALVFTLLAPRSGSAPPDAWFGPDKVKHFFMGAFVQSIAFAALRSTSLDRDPALAGASTATLALGMGKEFRDRRAYGRFSVRDLAWDAAGAGAASVVLVRTR